MKSWGDYTPHLSEAASGNVEENAEESSFPGVRLEYNGDLPMGGFFMRRIFAFVTVLISFSGSLLAQQTAPEAAVTSGGMTLWQVLQSGGVVMMVLGLLSLIMSALVMYLFLYLDPAKLVPAGLTRQCLQHLEKKNFDQVRRLLAGNESVLKNIIFAALEHKDQGADAIQETIELTARKEVTALWGWLNYLSDIAQVAPMLGLLGTVLGMIRAFNTIAFDTGVVKPILLAGGVSQAMITTAGGLTIAIMAMIFYTLLRPRVQNTTNLLQTETSLIMKAMKS